MAKKSIICEISQAIRDKFVWAAYSPKLNKIILLNGGKWKLLNRKGKVTGSYYTYADEKLWGKDMKADKLERLYTMCWEL